MNKNFQKIIGGFLAFIFVFSSVIWFSIEKKRDDNTMVSVAAAPANNDIAPIDNSIAEHVLLSVPDVTTKDGIRELMLNSTDYFQTVSGEFIYSMNDAEGDVFILSLECDIDASTAETHVMQVYPTNLTEVKEGMHPVYKEDDVPWARTQIADGTEWVLTDDLTGGVVAAGEVVTRDQLIHEPLEKRFYMNEDGTSSSVLRADPTNTYFARRILTPEEIAFSLLCSSDEWDIIDMEEYAGRECVVVSGKSPDFYIEKNGVVTFKMYVDKNTGILLKFVGLDERNQIVKFTYTNKIEIS
jgi:hypothetical protein